MTRNESRSHFRGVAKMVQSKEQLLTVLDSRRFKQWIEKTGAIGILSKAGRYGGTNAHKDIAFEFASWISVEFKLYLIKEFQRLKADEQKHLN